MTDKEIIQALECCNTEYDDYQCPHCPMLHKGCKKELVQQSLDLINRQKFQLDNYSHNVRNMSKDFLVQQKIIQEQRAEIKGLRDEIEHLHETIDDLYNTIGEWEE